MKKQDILSGLIIGEASAWLILAIFKNIRLELPFVWSLPFVLPVLCLAGLLVDDFLGRKFAILWQAAKFLLVGVLNTLIDLGILNLLILVSDVSSGLWFSVFKGASFTIAVINSYFWNKFWTFKSSVGEARQAPQLRSGQAKEFLQFFVVSAIGFGMNVGAASLVVNIVGPQLGLSDKLWANVGALIATFISMAWNFLGYKFIVFKR